MKLKVTKQTSMKRNNMKKVLFVSKRQITVYFKEEKLLARRGKIMLAKGIMEVLLNHPFYTLVVNSTNVEMHMSKQTVIGQKNNTVSMIVDPRWPVDSRWSIINPNLALLIPSRLMRVDNFLKG